MSDPLHALYEARAYPGISHPSTDPAVTSVVAAFAGLKVASPSQARILEIGCATGHNLLPLAARWPEAHCTGIDFSAPAIHEANEHREALQLQNLEFLQADLRNFDPGDVTYDFIIAHGFYSWVPEDVRRALLGFCAKHLSPNGIAVVSYNVMPGWSLRKPVAALAKLLATRHPQTIGANPHQALAFLATAVEGDSAYARHLREVVDEMAGRGPVTVAFDDCAPVNDPCTFLEFMSHASSHGLRYLGESVMAENLPAELEPESLEALKPLANDPLLFQQAIDVLTGRTFRSAVICRNEAPVQEKVPTSVVLPYYARLLKRFEKLPDSIRLVDEEGKEVAGTDQPLAIAFFTAMADAVTSCVSLHMIQERMGKHLKGGFNAMTDLPLFASLVFDAARRGLIELRSEGILFSPEVPSHPRLSRWNLRFAARKQLIIDGYHAACLFPERHFMLLAAMDGTRSKEELAALAAAHDPKLDFPRWLSHLAQRGMFAHAV